MNKIERLINELKTECTHNNLMCTISVKPMKLGYIPIMEFVTNYILDFYNISITEIRSWKKSNEARKAKQMIVFLLVNRLSTPINDVAQFLGLSYQIVSYMASHPQAIYKMDDYELFVYKIEKEMKETLYLFP